MKRLSLLLAVLPAFCHAQSWQGAAFWEKHQGASLVAIKPFATVPILKGRYQMEFSTFAGASAGTEAALGCVSLTFNHEVWRGFGWIVGPGMSEQVNAKPHLGLIAGLSLSF